jgi:hypothetical protein
VKRELVGQCPCFLAGAARRERADATADRTGVHTGRAQLQVQIAAVWVAQPWILEENVAS